jgi:hypothetical protein
LLVNDLPRGVAQNPAACPARKATAVQPFGQAQHFQILAHLVAADQQGLTIGAAGLQGMNSTPSGRKSMLAAAGQVAFNRVGA